MSARLQFRIGLVKPTKRIIAGRSIAATDRAWREAIFGLGGSRKRIGGVRLGTVDGQPLALIAELQTEITGDVPVWTIRTDLGLFGIAGPAAIYNDAGFGPATLGISIDRLKSMVEFDPDPQALEAALRKTLETRSQA